ncbi:MAG: site-specific DNA-methyltransferase [Leptospiraceae bacterium]|nr:site-specific DNA-methyltransferase [Leptospiraceae bacterium]
MTQTIHNIFTFDSRNLQEIIIPNTIDLVVTSPPYPMIRMWDELFFSMNSIIKDMILEKPQEAFELMNQELDKVWTALYSSIKDGGFLIINIGDATRTIKGDFQLYSNHSRIIYKCVELGFKNLPNILWRKQTNAPNKFMGSGMFPSGAYVTLEHEYILIFRKGTKQVYNETKKQNRRESSYFWEERNIWFSDIWEDVKGTKQLLTNQEARDRSAAYPFELVYRLINMYSCKGDTILDPFFGTGTTTLAAIASERNSIGIELEQSFKKSFLKNISFTNIQKLNEYICNRLYKHNDFVKCRIESGKEVKYYNQKLKTPVITRQEIDIIFNLLDSIKIIKEKIIINYMDHIGLLPYN